MPPAEPAVATGARVAVPGALDDMMLAMDVVDTLRHRERLVERELDEDLRELLIDALPVAGRSGTGTA